MNSVSQTLHPEFKKANYQALKTLAVQDFIIWETLLKRMQYSVTHASYSAKKIVVIKESPSQPKTFLTGKKPSRISESMKTVKCI